MYIPMYLLVASYTSGLIDENNSWSRHSYVEINGYCCVAKFSCACMAINNVVIYHKLHGYVVTMLIV